MKKENRTTEPDLSRRDFVKTTAVGIGGIGAAALAGIGGAGAEAAEIPHVLRRGQRYPGLYG